MTIPLRYFFYLHHLIQSPLHADTKKNIADYLETLQKRYQGLDYSSDMTLAAHYIVCATVDDILRCMAHHDIQYLQKFHQSQLEQEKFYIILERIGKQPEKYIDLLELIYLCMRFGYKGQHRHSPFGLQQWSLVADNTYHIINATRGNHRHYLSTQNSLSEPVEYTEKITKKYSRRQFYTITLLIFFILLLFTGILFHETFTLTRDTLEIYQ
ncbi:MAG: type IVB secretion system protein IcmH/DotU [Gammaproteobacteria bacterium]|nr:type IVB secretion system protein IcmH/DotU [Gammaproteobacteria bacterium]